MAARTIRSPRRDRWTSIARSAINDDRLSFRARGVLVWLLDKPDDWRIDSENISGGGREGREAIRTALRELEEYGYLTRERIQGERGKWTTESVLHETPADRPSPEPTTASRAPVDGPPTPGKPTPGKPTPVSRALRPKTVTEDCDRRLNTRADDAPPTLELVTETAPSPRADPSYRFEDFWRRYPRRNGGDRGDKGDALALWRKMSWVEKEAAWKALGPYIAYLERSTRYPKDAAKWLRERGWAKSYEPEPDAPVPGLPEGYDPDRSYTRYELEELGLSPPMQTLDPPDAPTSPVEPRERETRPDTPSGTPDGTERRTGAGG